jgi:hypothetical protein
MVIMIPWISMLKFGEGRQHLDGLKNIFNIKPAVLLILLAPLGLMEPNQSLNTFLMQIKLELSLLWLMY